MPKGRQKSVWHVNEQILAAGEIEARNEEENGSHSEVEELQAANDMARLQTILQELRDFRHENGDAL